MNPRSVKAFAEFKERLAELGATLLEPEWLGINKPHRVRCAAEHDCNPRPGHIQQGQGICSICVNNQRAAKAFAEFKERLAKIGATLLEPEWLGISKPHRVRCIAGHDCNPRPASIQQGNGVCCVCAGNDPITAEQEFRKKLDKIGAILLEPKWLGNHKPHHVRCAAGHSCKPFPSSVRQGKGICIICTRTVPAEKKFRTKLAELGATLLEPEWLGSDIPHRVRCAAGHDCNPRPNSVNQGKGVCYTCSGRNPIIAEFKFKNRLRELGAILLEPEWLGVHKPHKVRCVIGHICYPYPAGIQQGEGVCRFCVNKIWDVFYIVGDPSTLRIKFGITSGNPNPRLNDHRQYGFTKTIILLTKLPDGLALIMEQLSRERLQDMGIKPIRGREYFPPEALPHVLSVIRGE
jgi:hypothetical protein